MPDQSVKLPSLRPVVAFVLIGLAAVLAFFLACERQVDHDAFAKCLASRQVTMYGLYWCEHCAEQKKMFGLHFSTFRTSNVESKVRARKSLRAYRPELRIFLRGSFLMVRWWKVSGLWSS